MVDDATIVPESSALLVAQGFQVEPKSVKEAMSRPDAVEWTKAMDEEYKSLLENGTWESYNGPITNEPLPSKWVLSYKYNEYGQVVRCKARLVARGDRQREGIDYDETFSSTVRLESQRLVMAQAALEDMEIHQIDIKTAYLNGKLDRPILLRLTDGKVVKLIKGIYGLKQAGRCWKQCLDAVLRKDGFVPLHDDDSVYVKHRDHMGKKVILTVYVDDIIIASKHLSTINGVKAMLAKRFEVKDEGELHYILGLKVTRNRKNRTIHISQQAYIERLLKDFEMSNAKGTSMINLQNSVSDIDRS